MTNSSVLSKVNSRSIAAKAVKAAGSIANQYYSNYRELRSKADNSPVTEADFLAEKAMRQIIRDAFPGHAILGEEFGVDGESSYEWVLDPIDGTRNFAQGIPRFATSAALLHEGKVITSAIYLPMTDELFLAEEGRGATLNDQELRIPAASSPPLSSAVVAFCRSGKTRARFHELFSALESKIASPRILGSSLFMMTEVARGRFQGLVSTAPNIWDNAAGVLLVREAGGVACNLKGQQWRTCDQELVLGQDSVVRDLLKLI